MPFKHTKPMRKDDDIIKDTHRGLLYEDRVLVRILEAGRYKPPRLKWYERFIPEPTFRETRITALPKALA